MNSTNKNMVSAEEQAQVSRLLLVWLNQFPNKPVNKINFEDLEEDVGMAMSTVQGAYKTRQFIDGSYEAQHQFQVINRVIPSSNDERLKADEVLDMLGAWAESAEKPFLGDGITVKSITRNNAAGMLARYEGGIEDHQILITMIYEVI